MKGCEITVVGGWVDGVMEGLIQPSDGGLDGTHEEKKRGVGGGEENNCNSHYV